LAAFVSALRGILGEINSFLVLWRGPLFKEGESLRLVLVENHVSVGVNDETIVYEKE